MIVLKVLRRWLWQTFTSFCSDATRLLITTNGGAHMLNSIHPSKICHESLVSPWPQCLSIINHQAYTSLMPSKGFFPLASNHFCICRGRSHEEYYATFELLRGGKCYRSWHVSSSGNYVDRLFACLLKDLVQARILLQFAILIYLYLTPLLFTILWYKNSTGITRCNMLLSAMQFWEVKMVCQKY